MAPAPQQLTNTWSVVLRSPIGAYLTGFNQPQNAFIRVNASRVANGIGELEIVIPADASLWPYLVRHCRLALLFTPQGGSQQLFGQTTYLLTDRRYTESPDGEQLITIYAQDLMRLLTYRTIAYAAGSSQAEKSGAAETIMRAFVSENFGSGAAADRAINAYLSNATSAGSGPTVAKAASRREVLRALQEVCASAAQDGTRMYVDVVAGGDGAPPWQFQTFTGQRGANRGTESGRQLIFSRDAGTLTDISLHDSWADERTFVYAAGQGTGSARAIETASNAESLNADPLGRIELTSDERNSSTTAQLQAEAEKALWDSRPQRAFRGQLLNTPATPFGVAWNFGDRVVAAIEPLGVAFDVWVDSVSVEIAADVERINATAVAQVIL